MSEENYNELKTVLAEQHLQDALKPLIERNCVQLQAVQKNLDFHNSDAAVASFQNIVKDGRESPELVQAVTGLAQEQFIALGKGIVDFSTSPTQVLDVFSDAQFPFGKTVKSCRETGAF